MILLSAMLAAASPAPAAPATVLDCRLVTPNGDAIAFVARLNTMTAVLDPDPRSAWPARRIIGGGGLSQGKTIEAGYHFAGNPNGMDLRVKGERATLYVGKGLRSGLPRAQGFCLKMSEPPAAAADGTVSTDAGANVPAFDSARWPEDCSLVTRSGRRARINYTILDRGARAEFRSSVPGLFGSSPVSVRRSQASTGSPSRFVGNGVSGNERLILDNKAGQGVQLIEFDRTIDGGTEPAAAICGIRTVIRRPNVG
ncbi:MAG TPA: hypothetical protein VIT45_09100 [Allosphingosinicella sp.]